MTLNRQMMLLGIVALIMPLTACGGGSDVPGAIEDLEGEVFQGGIVIEWADDDWASGGWEITREGELVDVVGPGDTSYAGSSRGTSSEEPGRQPAYWTVRAVHQPEGGGQPARGPISGLTCPALGVCTVSDGPDPQVLEQTRARGEDEIVGACSPDRLRSQFEKVFVPCDEPHLSQIVAIVADQSDCADAVEAAVTTYPTDLTYGEILIPETGEYTCWVTASDLIVGSLLDGSATRY